MLTKVVGVDRPEHTKVLHVQFVTRSSMRERTLMIHVLFMWDSMHLTRTRKHLCVCV